MFDFVRNGYSLAVVGGRGDQEKIGQSGIDRIEFENASIFAFFVFTGRGCGLNENAGLFVRFGCAHAAEIVSSPIVVAVPSSGKQDEREDTPSTVQSVRCDVMANRVRDQLMTRAKAIERR